MEEVRAYVVAKLSTWGIELSDLELFMIMTSLNLLEQYEPLPPLEAIRLAKMALVQVIPELLLQPDITEGGYSFKRDKAGIIGYYGLLCTELDLPNVLSTKATLTDRSNAW